MAENFEMDVRIETNEDTISNLLKKDANISDIVKDPKNFKIVQINGIIHPDGDKSFMKDPEYYINSNIIGKTARKARRITKTIGKMLTTNPLKSLQNAFTNKKINKGGNRKTHKKKNSLNKSRKNKKSPM